MSISDLRQLRLTLRQRRRHLSHSSQNHAASSVKTLIARSQLLKVARKIAFYHASDGELNPLPVLRLALQLNKECYFPVVQRKRKELLFRRHKPSRRMRKNHYGILEPAPGGIPIKASQLDLIFMPLVGFDGQGNRLGMGGGYYDHTLKPGLASRNPLLVGLAHSCQQVAKLAPQPWDVALDMVITEKEILRCRNKATSTFVPARAKKNRQG